MANLKERIRRGEDVLGVSVSMNVEKDRLAAIIESGPYDYVWVDAQHSPFNEERLVEFCGIANEMGVPAWVRLKHTRDAVLVGNYLDLGPSGIEVPQVETVETVNTALDGFYYPQTGLRSWGGTARVGFEGREDRLVSRSRTQCAERQKKRVRARGAADRVRNVQVSGELPLERALDNIVETTKKSRAKAADALRHQNPQNRFIAPEEVAAAVAWLCQPGSESITGQAAFRFKGDVGTADER